MENDEQISSVQWAEGQTRFRLCFAHLIRQRKETPIHGEGPTWTEQAADATPEQFYKLIHERFGNWQAFEDWLDQSEKRARACPENIEEERRRIREQGFDYLTLERERHEFPSPEEMDDELL